MFATPAWAQDAAASGDMQTLFAQIWPMVALFGIAYFFMLKPQFDKEKSHKKLVTELKKGDNIVTSGGIFGTVDQVKERSCMVTVASGVKIEIAKAAISKKVED